VAILIRPGTTGTIESAFLIHFEKPLQTSDSPRLFNISLNAAITAGIPAAQFLASEISNSKDALDFEQRSMYHLQS
jgi:hypothetical protein